MILSLEGSRNSGKTYLLDKFFEQNTDPRIIRYKFDFAGWVDKLGLKNDDTRSDLHYLCLGSLLTIMERMHNDNTKLIVLDRGLFSCYVWSQLRKRIGWNTAVAEITAVLKSPVYSNFTTVFVNAFKKDETDNRNKDMWDNMHTKTEETRMYRELFEETILEHYSFDNNCNWKEFNNYFDEYSTKNFIDFIKDTARLELVD